MTSSGGVVDRIGGLLSDLAGAHLDGTAVDRPEIDRPEIQRLRHFLAAGGDVCSPDRFVPGHVTGSAFVVAPEGDAVALVLHRKIGRWVQPGGHVEPGDRSVEETARRETAEEIGLTDVEPLGLVDVDIHHFPEVGTRPGHLHFDVRYLYRCRSGSLRVGDGVSAVRWVPFEEALGMDDSIARAVGRIAGDGSGWRRPAHWYPLRPT